MSDGNEDGVRGFEYSDYSLDHSEDDDAESSEHEDDDDDTPIVLPNTVMQRVADDFHRKHPNFATATSNFLSSLEAKREEEEERDRPVVSYVDTINSMYDRQVTELASNALQALHAQAQEAKKAENKEPEMPPFPREYPRLFGGGVTNYADTIRSIYRGAMEEFAKEKGRAAASSHLGRYYVWLYERLEPVSRVVVMQQQSFGDPYEVASSIDDVDAADKDWLNEYIRLGSELKSDRHLYEMIAARPEGYAPFDDSLPDDLLRDGIMCHIVDFVAFRGVCRKWRNIMTHHLLKQDERDGWYPNAEVMLYRKFDENRGRLTILYNMKRWEDDKEELQRRRRCMRNPIRTGPWKDLAPDQRKIAVVFAAIFQRNKEADRTSEKPHIRL